MIDEKRLAEFIKDDISIFDEKCDKLNMNDQEYIRYRAMTSEAYKIIGYIEAMREANNVRKTKKVSKEKY